MIRQTVLIHGLISVILLLPAGCSYLRHYPVKASIEKSVIRNGSERDYGMPQEKFFYTGKVKINYLDNGSTSAEPLVMLHGGAWRWQEYLSLIPTLSQRWHVYALDLRENGKSDWLAEQYRLQDFTDDIAAFIKQLNAPAVLVGHSLGCVIALMAATRYPEKVKALILEDPVLTVENYKRVVESSREMYGIWLNLKRSAQSEQELALALAEKFFKDYPGVTSSWMLFFAGCLWQLDPTYFNAMLYDFNSFIKGYDYKTILAQIKCPILFISGDVELGAVLSDDEISWLKQNCSTVQYAHISGVGHLLHLEDKGQTPVLTELTTFLERIPQ